MTLKGRKFVKTGKKDLSRFIFKVAYEKQFINVENYMIRRELSAGISRREVLGV